MQGYFQRRLTDLQTAVAEAADFDAAATAGLNLAASWAPDALAHILDQVLTLAGLEGREAVFGDDEPAAPATVALAGEDSIRQEFARQIDFLTQKRGKPTRVWTDAMRHDHDRAFVVAGVTDLAMLDEFQTAIVDGAKSYDIKTFAKDFDRLVEKYGWSYNGGRDWRIKTIFETNIRTSYMAGRLQQMRDPNMVKARPYWQYIHADSRVPLNPRPEHVEWDGLVLNWDDPWWDQHFPPNDWKCSCGMRSLSRLGLQRLGKDGPDQAPATKMVTVPLKSTGETVEVPEGIGYGWDYMPGDHWERGLVPSRLIVDETQQGTAQMPSLDTAEPLADLLQKSRPFKAAELPDDLRPEEYVSAFLEPFGAALGRPAIWEDVAGHRLTVSEALFQTWDGKWKLTKRGRETHAAMLAEAIMDPDEIWLGLREKPLDAFEGYSDLVVSRRYIRVDEKTGLLAVFELGRHFWEASTGFAPRSRSKPDWAYLNRQRVGKLIWKRK